MSEYTQDAIQIELPKAITREPILRKELVNMLQSKCPNIQVHFHLEFCACGKHSTGDMIVCNLLNTPPSEALEAGSVIGAFIASIRMREDQHERLLEDIMEN